MTPAWRSARRWGRRWLNPIPGKAAHLCLNTSKSKAQAKRKALSRLLQPAESLIFMQSKKRASAPPRQAVRKVEAFFR